MGRKVSTDEFKKAAVDQVVGQRHTLSSVAKRLGVNYQTLREWVQAAKSGGLPAFPEPVRVRAASSYVQ